MEHKKYDDDDGRTIADMGDIHQANAMGGEPRGPKQFEDSGSKYPRTELSVKERLGMVWMALRAALLIGLAFIVGLGLIIWLMLFFWT